MYKVIRVVVWFDRKFVKNCKICEKCEKVTELEKDNLKSFFGTLSQSANFEYSDHNLEIFGCCNACR